MSTPDATGSGRPLRTAGLVLLGVAAVALLLGLFGVAGGDDSDEIAAESRPPAASTQPGGSTTNPTGTVSPTGTAGSTSSTSTATSTAAPTATSTATPTGAPPSTGAPVAPPPIITPGAGPGTGEPTRGAVRVYNNSTIRGLAARAAQDMRAVGWSVREVGNYSGGTIPTTTVYYDDESGRSAADALGENFGMRIEPRFEGIRDATPGLIVIVTNDYSS